MADSVSLGQIQRSLDGDDRALYPEIESLSLAADNFALESELCNILLYTSVYRKKGT